MAYPLAYAKKSINSTPNTSVRPGEYDSVLIDIKPNPKFVEGDAFIFTYDLTDTKTCEKYSKSETLINRSDNPRLKIILDNLKAHKIAIENVDDLLGMHENLTLKYEVSGSRAYCNIVGREFVDFVPVGGGADDVL